MNTPPTSVLDETVAFNKLTLRHLIWTCTISMVMGLAVLIVIAFKDNGVEKAVQPVVTGLNNLGNIVTDDGNASRTVLNNAVAELKEAVGTTTTAVIKADENNVTTLDKGFHLVNERLQVEGVKSAKTSAELQEAVVAGLAGVTVQVKESGNTVKASAENLASSLAEVRSELASMRVNPTIVATETPATMTLGRTPTDGVNVSRIPGGIPNTSSRSIKESGPNTHYDLIKVEAGNESQKFFREDIDSGKVQLDDTSGIIAVSYPRGWGRSLGQGVVTDKVPVARGAGRVAFVHQSSSFHIRVKKS